MSSVIRIGSRQSRLAVIQAELIKEQIESLHPEIRAEIVTMKTTGDKILDKSLAAIGGKGLFVRELDKALEAGDIDISVHSLKDMPMETPKALPILAYSKREDPRDVLVFPPDTKEDLAKSPKERALEREALLSEAGAVIGTSSFRRSLQLKQLYPRCAFRGIRGNVQTRLNKLKTEGYTATVLAAAGLHRLGMRHVIGRYLSVEEMIPAAGQGILAVQGRADEAHPYLEGIDDGDSKAAALAERAFVRALDGGCTSPVAAYAKVRGSELMLTGLYCEAVSPGLSGGETLPYGAFFVERITGEKEQAEKLGETLALRMRKEAGR